MKLYKSLIVKCKPINFEKVQKFFFDKKVGWCSSKFHLLDFDEIENVEGENLREVDYFYIIYSKPYNYIFYRTKDVSCSIYELVDYIFINDEELFKKANMNIE